MTLYYRETGNKDGSMMFFIHGGGVSSWMWEKQMQYFSQYHCVAIDLPEQGKSNHTAKFSIKYSAERAIEIIEKIANDKKVIVIGFSLGAQVAIQMLSIKPNLIHYAVINSALVRPNSFVKKLIRPTIKLTFPLIKNKSFSKLQAKTLYIDMEHFETYYKESSLMKSDTLVRILEENMSFELPEDFNKAKGKILVTVGEREKAVMKKSAKDIILNNSNCLGVIIPNVSHGIPLVHPDFFNQLVEKWIIDGEIPDGKTINIS
ncbi:alpha/beta hydrolase [Virgibacillus pantothenticus]|uniref:alpha/beta fold hydrolase n=1 Tax=Virgibacillus TaxID=84406 RepID=UPI00090BF79A|nr:MULTISPECIES: alpha/beta hydrolase [Virgibacillus]API94168.1 alpha/beta hydrolase [Virgibacillus sp. 6R]MBS7426670.1 alpha/beta hydrolase [Virgibacillus sp. 19R1-5]MBU8568394.1 alpha/beta hydrolase [Virgibacillus pantothenticus]MBU8602421.1 alpha/beta hydrolase [Virgibacillus pantothenticus]MBU8636557.1 alpha/beta hydrolase [Virgibacillus pantothenticus]